MTIYEFKQAFITAIDQGLRVLEAVKAKIKNRTDDEVDLDKIDYNLIIYNLETTIENLQQQKVRFRYDKMDEQQFDYLLANVLAGRKGTMIPTSVEHKLRTIDTLHLLGEIYKVNILDILRYNNNMNIEDFEDKKYRNEVILIPQEIDIAQRETIFTMKVYGSLDGTKAWGSDWGNELEAGEDGDFKILDNISTLGQSILNSFGDYGDIPGYEMNLLDLDWGSDNTSEVFDMISLVKIKNFLLQDPRIKDVVDVTITTESNNKRIKLTIIPINSNMEQEIIK